MARKFASRLRGAAATGAATLRSLSARLGLFAKWDALDGGNKAIASPGQRHNKSRFVAVSPRASRMRFTAELTPCS